MLAEKIRKQPAALLKRSHLNRHLTECFPLGSHKNMVRTPNSMFGPKSLVPRQSLSFEVHWNRLALWKQARTGANGFTRARKLIRICFWGARLYLTLRG
jgi:hypothetical protein